MHIKNLHGHIWVHANAYLQSMYAIAIRHAILCALVHRVKPMFSRDAYSVLCIYIDMS